MQEVRPTPVFRSIGMIYLIGGAPRAGKTILGQSISAKRNVGWISTDLLVDLLRLKNEDGVKASWNAAPEAIAADAEWFFPYLERFIWGVSSQAEGYLIEGVGFLPAQVARLSAEYPIRAVFLGCSRMTLEQFDQFPGRSRGYAGLPEALRRQIVRTSPAGAASYARKPNASVIRMWIWPATSHYACVKPRPLAQCKAVG